MNVMWWSQPFPPDGSVTAEGIERNLGTPALHPLTVLVRETAQNAWDARSGESVDFTLAFTRLSGVAVEEYRRLLLPHPGQGTELERHLDENPLVLRVSDRGTSGLGGPIRSDVASGERPDFVNLVRNVGVVRDTDLGGGTYGFGKGILFRLSSAGTILVDTLCRYDGGLQRRLIGSSLGASYVAGDRRFTGRHWWGSVEPDGIPDPLLDDRAAQYADRLGLCGFSDGRTGTDIYVLCPELRDEELKPVPVERAAGMLVSAACWYLWPKLVERSGQKPFSLRIEVDGTEIAVPDPAKSPRLRSFVRALRRLDAGESTPLARASKPRAVGEWAAVMDPYTAVETDRVLQLAEPFEGPARHCARMRQVELVVDYVEGPALGETDIQHAAVFRASREADEHFAAAEPPTHDNWVTQHLQGTDLGVVRQANSFVRDQLRELVLPMAASGAVGGLSLANVANHLARLLPGQSGDGASEGDSDGHGAGGGGGGGSALSRTVEGPRLEAFGEDLRVLTTVRFADSPHKLSAVVTASVSVDGGRESAPPAGDPVPEILGWVDEHGSWRDGDNLIVAPSESRTWTSHVRPAPGSMTGVTIRTVISAEDEADA